MSVLGKYFKTPTERKRYSISYSDWLDAGETVMDVTFEVTPAAATPVVIDGITVDTDAKGVAFYASAGADGTTYKVLVTMITAQGQTKEDTVQYSVKAPPTA